jgi:hypothetical protein
MAEIDDEVKDDLEVIASPDKVQEFQYPAKQYPSKVVSFNLDKNPVLDGQLNAVKGQYLILDSGVINIRKYAGYLVNIELS